MFSFKRIKKSRMVLLICASIIVIGGLYFLLRQISSADIQEAINTQIKLSQISTSSDISGAKSVGTVELTVPRGETESFALLLDNTSSTNYPNFTIQKSDLLNSSGQRISSGVIDERVVHNWNQKVTDYTQTPKGGFEQKVDELLVKNEKPNLTLPTDSKYGGDTFFSSDITNEKDRLLTSGGSSQRESSDGTLEKVKTTVSASSKKKFFFKIKMPAASQGSYNSTISFVDAANQKTVAKFNLKVNTAPYSLEKVSTSKFSMGCYTNDQVAKDSSNVQMFTNRLQTAHDYGCEQLVFRVNTSVNNTKGLEIISQLGFKGPVILNFGFVKADGNINKDTTISSAQEKSQFTQILNEIKNDPKITVPMLFYGVDEPNTTTVRSGETLSRYDMHKLKSDNIKSIINSVFGTTPPSKIIRQVTTSATQATFNSLAQDDRYKTDYPMVNAIDLASISGSIRQGQLNVKPHQTYYYQGYYEIQKQNGLFNSNRFMSGLAVVNTGLNGAMMNPVFGYSSINIRPLYDDMLLTADLFEGKSWHKQMLTFYPAVDGYIPTLQSEGWREGNMDLRYYLSYAKVKDNINANFSATKKTELTNLKNQIENQVGRYQVSANYASGAFADNLTDLDMDQTRKLLQNFLISYYSTDTSQASLIDTMNLKNGDTISTSPYIIKVKPKGGVSISRAELYINNVKYATATSISSDATYHFAWNAGSERLTTALVKATLVNGSGEQESLTAQVNLNFPAGNPSVNPSVVPSLTDSSTPAPFVSVNPSVTTSATGSQTPLDNQAPVIEDLPNTTTDKPTIFAIAKVTDNVKVSAVEFWIGSESKVVTHYPDLDYYYETRLELKNTGPNIINVVAYDEAGNKSQKSYTITYTPLISDNQSQNYVSATVTAEENLDNDQPSPIAAQEIVEVLPKTGSESIWHKIIYLLTFQWIN